MLPIFFINLASRPDRRAFIEGQLAALGLTAERVEGTPVDQLPADLIARHCDQRRTLRQRPTDLACSMGHHRAWQRIVELRATAGLVLEDDAVLTPALLDFLADDLLERLDADIVKLETVRKPIKLGSRAQHVGNTELRELGSSHMGGAAYLIGARTARASLADPACYDLPVDRLLFGRGGPHLLQSRVLQAVPSPVAQLEMLRNAGDFAHLARSDIAVPSMAARRTQRADLVDHLRVSWHHARVLLAAASRDAGIILNRRRRVPFRADPEQPA